MFSKSGRGVVSRRSDKVLMHSASDTRDAMTFVLVQCRALERVSAEQRPRCFSLMVPGTNRYVRQWGYHLYLRRAQDDLGFELDSSFILHVDTFYWGYYTFENVHYPLHFTWFRSDGYMLIWPETYSTAHHDAASFGLYVPDTSRGYHCLCFAFYIVKSIFRILYLLPVQLLLLC